MKPCIARVLVAAAALIACAGSAQASIHVGDRIKFGNGPGSPGGIFYVNNLTNPAAPAFSTFCVEIEEFINFTSTFAVESITKTTVLGDKKLTPFAAWLYNSFLDGALASFNPTKTSDVNALQLGIWTAIGYSESDIRTRIGNNWYDTYSTHYNNKLPAWQTAFNADVTAGDWTGVGMIRVMNIRKVNSQNEYTAYAQDQLVRVDVVPEPLSAVVWSLLAVCLGSVWSGRRSRLVG